MDLSKEETEMYKKIGKNLGKIRGERTQEEVAKKIGMKASNYNSIESGYGERHLKDFQLIKLAKFYNTTTDFLLGLRNESTNDIEKTDIVDKYGLSEQALDYLSITNRFENKEMNGELKRFYKSEIDTINHLFENTEIIDLIDAYFNSYVSEHYVLGFTHHGDIALYDMRKDKRMMGRYFVESTQIEETLLLLIENELRKMKKQIKEGEENEHKGNRKK